MNDIKRFLFKITLLTVGIAIIMLVLGLFDNKVIKNNYDTIYKLQQSSNHDSLDYLVVGNSYGYSDVSPDPFDSLGLRYYNLSMPAAGPYYYEVVLNDYLMHATTLPKNVLMTFSPITFTDICDDWGAYTIHRSLLAPITHEQVALKYNIGLKQYLTLRVKSAQLGFDNLYYSAVHKSFAPDETFRDTKGFVRKPGVVAPKDTIESGTPWNTMRDREFMVNKYEYMKVIMDKLREHGVNVILFEPPTFHTEQFFSQSFLTEYEKSLNELQSQGYTVMRKDGFQDIVKVENFTNMDHMNNPGATRYTERLLAELHVAPGSYGKGNN